MTLLSRIFGFLRDMVITRYFGASPATDAFFAAFKIPNFFRRLFAEGAFALAFVPVLAEVKASGDRQALRELIDRVSGTLIGILLVIVGLGMFFAHGLIGLFAPGFVAQPEQHQLAAEMLVITFPYLLMVSVAGMFAGILNTFDRFALPSFTPVLLNLSMISAVFILSRSFEQPVMSLAVGVTVGGAFQLLFLMPALHKQGLLPRPRWGWAYPRVRQVLRLMGPSIFGSSVAQINLLVDTLLASLLVSGSLSWLYLSDRILEFPMGVFAIALSTVILPRLSARVAESDEAMFAATLHWAIRLGALVALPAAIGMGVLALPLMSTLFGYGAWDNNDVAMAALSLQMLAIGLPAFMAVKILAPAFYARQDTRTPVRIGIVALVSNMFLNVVFVALFVIYSAGEVPAYPSGSFLVAVKSWLAVPGAHSGLALASAVSGFVNAIGLYLALRGQGYLRSDVMPVGVVLRLMAGLLVMLAVLLVGIQVSGDWHDLGWIMRSIRLSLLILAGGVAYFGTLFLAGLRPRQFLSAPE